MVSSNQHDQLVDTDYAAVRDHGLTTVRETVRWHLVEASAGTFDFRTLEPMVAAARRHQLQVIWTLCHYGWPDDLELLSSEFVARFARYCRVVASFLQERGDGHIYIPVNEMSFLSWAAGEIGWFHPYLRGRGADVKRQLTRACLAGIAEIRAVNPDAIIMTSEPLIHVVGDDDTVQHREAAAAYRASQFEACDQLIDPIEAPAAGRPDAVDVIGLNFYHDNQWAHPSGRKLGWHHEPRDTRWLPLHKLLLEVFERYRRPLYVTETSHVGVGRVGWLRELTLEVQLALDVGVPVWGVCLYPIVDRCDWDTASHWHNSGLWDVALDRDGTLRRVLHREYAEVLAWAQDLGLEPHSEPRADVAALGSARSACNA